MFKFKYKRKIGNKIYKLKFKITVKKIIMLSLAVVAIVKEVLM